MHNGRTGQTFYLMDRNLLAEVIAKAKAPYKSLRAGWLVTNEAIKRRTQRRGTSPAGTDVRRRRKPVDYSTIHRLQHRKTGQVKRETFNWLLAFVPKADHERLLAAIVTPGSQVLLDGHQAWMQSEAERIEGRKGDSPGIRRELSALRRRRVHRLIDDMREIAPEAFDRFDGATGHHSDARIWLSLLRLVAPFLISGDTTGVERSWGELSEEDRKSYIAAGLKKELVLLNRRADLHRAQAVARMSPTYDAPAPLG